MLAHKYFLRGPGRDLGRSPADQHYAIHLTVELQKICRRYLESL